MSVEDSVEFADNPEPRCPCVLLLDTSASMTGEPIRALQEGIRAFKEHIMQDALAAKRVDVAIVTFDSAVNVVQDFVTVDHFNPPNFSQLGPRTIMSAGISRALELVKARKVQYGESGIQYYRPWVFMITDGAPTEAESEINNAVEQIRSAEATKQISFWAVGTDTANMDVLRKISTARGPVKLNGLDFRSMFEWLSSSMKRVSVSRAGEQVPLQAVGWGSAG
jgi:uncharacterized protein YegL